MLSEGMTDAEVEQFKRDCENWSKFRETVKDAGDLNESLREALNHMHEMPVDPAAFRELVAKVSRIETVLRKYLWNECKTALASELNERKETDGKGS